MLIAYAEIAYFHHSIYTMFNRLPIYYFQMLDHLLIQYFQKRYNSCQKLYCNDNRYRLQ